MLLLLLLLLPLKSVARSSYKLQLSVCVSGRRERLILAAPAGMFMSGSQSNQR